MRETRSGFSPFPWRPAIWRPSGRKANFPRTDIGDRTSSTWPGNWRNGGRCAPIPRPGRAACPVERVRIEADAGQIRRDLERYRVRFDVWFSERSLYESGAVEQVLKELADRGYTYEKDGAVWLKSTAFGDDKDRVLVKSDGSYTYLTPDIAYHRDKLNRGFDRLINIWGADHHGYIPRMKAAIAAQGHDPERLTVLVTQMVKLYQGGELVKMSKRTGKAVTLEELMDEVGIDAVRYFFVMRSSDSHLDFDMDLAVSRSNENPVYYVQYAHARIQSVFRQAGERGLSPAADPETLSLLAEEQEYDLLQALAAFPDEVAGAAQQLTPTGWCGICMIWPPSSTAITERIGSSAMTRTCREPDWPFSRGWPRCSKTACP